MAAASDTLDRHEREMCEVLKERDDAQEWADKLAFALGGPAIGEHSSMNNPWQNALDNPAPVSPYEGLRAEFEQAVTDPDLDTGVAGWLDALNAYLGVAVRGTDPTGGQNDG